MLEGMLFAIGSWFFMLLLIIVYELKVKQAGFKNYLYSFSIELLFIMVTLQLVSVFTITNYEIIPIQNEILCRVIYSFTIIWLMIISLYIVSKYKKLDMSSYKKIIENIKNIKMLITIFFTYVFFIVLFFFLPFDYVIVDEIGYVFGPALIFVYFVSIISGMILTILILKLTKDETFIKKLPIYLSIIETLIIVPLQLFNPEILIVSCGLVFKEYLIYFLFENTDLYLINELKKGKEKLDKSNTTKSEFLFNMSHEIRTPMNAIVGFSSNILNDEDMKLKEIKKDVKKIYTAGSNLLEIINNILNISNIETGIEKIENKEYSINSIVLELMSIIESRIDKSKVSFITEIDSNINILKGDKVKLFQILLNILSNSAKYTENGKIILKITQTKKERTTILHIEISDTGFGIKEEDYDKLFEKFSRLDNALEHEIEGTGLGLVITKRMVDLLHGKIWFKSIYGAGTTFYIDLEQEMTNKVNDLNIGERNKILNYLDCSNYSALLVDDNLLNLKVMERLLEQYKFKVKCISNSKECINNIKLGNKYDIIFLDHMMPELDGIEVLNILKHLEGYTIPPVVAVTANAITGMREMYLNAGFDEYLSKPVSVSSLDKLINKYFNKK